MGGFLDYVPGDSLLHRLNPLTKLVLSLVLCVSCFLTGFHLYVLGVIALNLVYGAAAGVFDRSLRVLRAMAKLCIVLFLAQIFFVRDGHELLRLPLGLVITDAGLSFSLLFCLRVIASAMPLALFLSVTRLSDLTGVLTGRLHIPYRYTFALTTAIRFIPIFTNEMAAVMEAQITRGIDFDTRNFFKKLRLLLPLCVPLLVSSVKKIDSGAVAAELRGFNLRPQGSGYRQYFFRAADFAAFCGSFALVAALLVLPRVL